MDSTLIVSAFLAGLVSFVMPCTLPLVPGFFAFIAGSIEPNERKEKDSKLKFRMFKNSLFFVLGFSLVFVGFGTIAGVIGNALSQYRGILNKIGGLIIILFGLFMLDILRVPNLEKNKSIFIPKLLVPGKSESSFVLGVALGLGWTPCIGPLLGSILLLASTSESIVSGGFLLAIFSLGLGLPFILISLTGAHLLDKIKNKKYFRLFPKIAGGFLILVGILQIFGKFGYITSKILNVSSFGFYQRLLDFL